PGRPRPGGRHRLAWATDADASATDPQRGPRRPPGRSVLPRGQRSGPRGAQWCARVICVPRRARRRVDCGVCFLRCLLSVGSPKRGTAKLTDVVANEIAHEHAHVDKVYRRLAELTQSAQGVAADGRSRHQVDRMSHVREEDGTSLFERDAFSFQAAKRLATLEAEHDGLVFGRLDRRDGDVRYVGRLGVRDAEYEPLVIDWRARAAEPFYRATPADPMEVVRRRVLRCRGERVIGIEDDLLDGEGADDQLVVVGEGALLAALSRSRGPRMRDIVATIQAEQDEAIRAPYAGVTMITGGPGTGKTVVALHRAAYLLYSHRRRFENGGVLVVGPSSVFMNYIERVLPSLGEDSVTLRSIGQVASDVVPLGPERLDGAAAATVK